MVLTFFIPDMHKIEIILRMKSADSCYFSKHHHLLLVIRGPPLGTFIAIPRGSSEGARKLPSKIGALHSQTPPPQPRPEMIDGNSPTLHLAKEKGKGPDREEEIVSDSACASSLGCNSPPSLSDPQ